MDYWSSRAGQSDRYDTHSGGCSQPTCSKYSIHYGLIIIKGGFRGPSIAQKHWSEMRPLLKDPQDKDTIEKRLYHVRTRADSKAAWSHKCP